ncbi:hypothetical protein TWF696_007068 [Orbilia brochopaga]|uniref:Inner centromere protein ARK-binding domain-containing protein n=1 Tax=Orbilia brochopaga TaxID=3140254 RepID=A0AAV9UQT9_9PEZI
MASRTALPDVGSPRWIFNELADAHRKEADHFEDFTIAIRNELEWLHEHMAEIFHQGSEIDIADLYKTPGKLRGKTPRVIRKIDTRSEPHDDDLLPTNLVNPLTALVTSQPHLVHSDPRSSDSKASTPELIRDSEAWSGSSAASATGSFGASVCGPIERSSPAKKPLYQNAPDIVPEVADRRTFSDATRRSFLSAKEGYSDAVGHSPESRPATGLVDTEAHNVTEAVSDKQLEENQPSDPGSNIYHDCIPLLDKDTAERTPEHWPISQPINPQTPLNPKTLNASPDQTRIREFSVSPVQTSAATPASPISPIQQFEPMITPKSIPIEPVISSETPSEAASPIPIVDTNAMTRGSMNFASLPARETLTHKKSMGGANPASRSSHVDDRTSIFGRLTGGKSLGASGIMSEVGPVDGATVSGTAIAQPILPNASDEDDDDDDLNEQLRLAEINKTSVMHLSEKTSTQRLNEKISKLSQQGSNRLSKSTSTSSISISSQGDDKESLNTKVVDTKAATEAFPKGRESTLSDEGDWIPSRTHTQKPQTMTSMAHTASSIPSETHLSQNATIASPRPIPTTPTATKLPIPVSTIKKTFDGNVVYPQLPTGTPKPVPPNSADTPLISKATSDLEINTAKKNQANIFSFAKQLLWRSGRAESPRTAQSKPLTQKDDNAEASPSERSIKPNEAIRETPRKPLYPDIRSPVLDTSTDLNQLGTPHSPINSQPPHPTDALLTATEDTKPSDVVKGENRTKIPAQMVAEGLDLLHENTDGVLRSPVISDNDPSLPGSPFSSSEKSDAESDQDEGAVQLPGSKYGSRNEATKLPQTAVNATPSRDDFKEPRTGTSIQSKFSDIKKTGRGLFGVKDAGIAKPKVTSSNIRLVTASQRELDQRKNGPPSIPQNPATLVGALAETFGPAKEPTARPASAMSTASTHSLRVPKSIAALNSAAKAQKREQEEKERKAAQKQEIERRRQENMKRGETRREEERKQQAIKAGKKQLGKQHVSDEDDAKKRQNGPNKALQPLLNPSKLLPKATLFSQKPATTASKSYHEVKRQQKRLFPGDDDHKSQKEGAGPPSTSHQDSKRRKTGDSGETPIRSAFAPPIRQSTAKKENALPSKIGGIFSQDYTPAAHSHPHPAQGSSLVKSALVPPQSSKPGAPLPVVDVVKYSHDKLKFGTMVTPAPQKTGLRQSAVSHESPLYPNPENIELPEIHTDSEDERDEKAFRVPKWADSPELRQALQDQLGIDPETIFGPIAPLSMEDIFKGRADRAKFRARTSSANWSGADRLTAAEIEADRIERQRILENGGWTYQKPK